MSMVTKAGTELPALPAADSRVNRGCQAVMAHADWVIDLGPVASHDGGRIVFEGTPADHAAARPTLTGEHLAAYTGLSNGSQSENPGGSAR